MRSTLLAPLIGLTLALAACAGSGESPQTQAPQPVATQPGAPQPDSPEGTGDSPASTGQGTAADQAADSTGSPDGPQGSGCTPDSETSLPDGSWFGYVDSVSESEMSFDLACWFTGEAAAAAAVEDGAATPLTDYYVRNNNELTRPLEIAPEASITFYRSGDPQSEEQGDVAAWREVLDSRGTLFGVWVTITDGAISDVKEVWVP